jgi:putative transposase
LNDLLKDRKRPKSIACDNGTEFISKAMFFWYREIQLKLSFIQLWRPTENAFVESFNDKFSNTCLNEHWLRSLDEAREIMKTWRKDCY